MRRRKGEEFPAFRLRRKVGHPLGYQARRVIHPPFGKELRRNLHAPKPRAPRPLHFAMNYTSGILSAWLVVETKKYDKAATGPPVPVYFGEFVV
jgi:hypothetical protein